MATNRSQQFSARNLSTHRLFNIFGKLRLMLVAGLLLLPQLLAAQWNATVGAESSDLGRQGLAFLPNEIWIHAGDSITWTVAVAEPHTVAFLTDGQLRPPFNVGCPGFSTGSAVFDGSSCITSALLFNGAKLTVTFPVEATSNWFAWSTVTWRALCMFSIRPNPCPTTKSFMIVWRRPRAQLCWPIEMPRSRSTWIRRIV